MFEKLAFAAIVLVGMSTAPQAATYNVLFTGNTLNFTGTFVTDGSDLVTLASGSVGTDTVVNVMPTGDPLAITYYIYDNIFTAAAPYMTSGGVVFKTVSNALYNLYFDNGATSFIYQAANSAPGQFTLESGSLMVTQVSEVPVPAAGVMLLSGLAGLGALRRRRADKAARSQPLVGSLGLI
jgi:hypothetical protein